MSLTVNSRAGGGVLAIDASMNRGSRADRIDLVEYKISVQAPVGRTVLQDVLQTPEWLDLRLAGQPLNRTGRRSVQLEPLRAIFGPKQAILRSVSSNLSV
jgi:hypothetical protein